MKDKEDNTIKTNLVMMPKGTFILFGLVMFILGDMEACNRINKKTLKKLLGLDKETEDESGDDEI